MSWLLCARCLEWVSPRGGCCPLCAGALDEAAGDPTPAELAERVGLPTGCLGEVKVRRRSLPGRGLLVTTTRGLFFLPHRPEVVEDPADRPGLGVTVGWWAVGLAVGPAALAVPAARWLGFGGWGRADRRTVYEPRRVEEGDGAALVEHLMADPGAFFLAREDVRALAPAGPWPLTGWTAECRHRAPVRFAALSDPGGVRAAVAELGRADAWCGAVFC